MTRNQTIYYLHSDVVNTAVFLHGSGAVDAVI